MLSSPHVVVCDLGCIDSVLPPVTGVKSFDPLFSALTLDLGQILTLTFDQNLTTPICSTL